jgi:hypothetical protein
VIEDVSLDGEERYELTVTFAPFRIQLKVNNVVTMIINKKDTLMFEDYTPFYTQIPV